MITEANIRAAYEHIERVQQELMDGDPLNIGTEEEQKERVNTWAQEEGIALKDITDFLYSQGIRDLDMLTGVIMGIRLGILAERNAKEF